MAKTSTIANRFAGLAAILGVAGLLSGCGMGTITHTETVHLTMQGTVHGGQQGISGATIQLYTVGTSGNGSAATPLIPTVTGGYFLGGAPGCLASSSQVCYNNVYSDANGFFTITGDYTCPTSSAQVYIVGTGGYPGPNNGTNNAALVLMDALGSCGTLATIPYVTINEVTTVAAAWALAPFMTSYTNVGSSATNAAGLANAMLDAQLLADPSYGVSPGSALPSANTVESGKVYALADALAPCVNSAGTTACSSLFSAATQGTSAAPTNTLSAALNIVKNPGKNVQAVWNAVNPQAAFATSLTQAPNDWTMSMTVTNAAFLLPTAIDIDANGYIWFVGQEGQLTALTPQGSIFVNDSYANGYLREVFGLTIDTNGYVWATDFESAADSAGALVLFNGSSSSSPGTPITYFDDSSLQYPDAVAADTNGNVFMDNSYTSSASVYNTSGLVAGSLGSQYEAATDPQAIAVDLNHGFWLSDGDYTVSHYNSSGTSLSHVVCCTESYGIATDNGGNLWVSNYANSTFSEVTTAATNNVPLNQVSGGGVYYPAGVAVDAGQNVWFANYRGATISEIAGNAGTVLAGTSTPLAAGTAISPSTGTYGGNGGYGLDASLSEPIALVPDTSGNVWVANYGNNDVVMFFGLATPTKMPVLPSPTAP